MRYLYYILFLAICILSVSCEDDSCTIDTESTVVLKYEIGDESAVIQDNLFARSEEWHDTINTVNKQMSFLLSVNDTISEIIIESTDITLVDTLKFIHENELVYLSKECGFIVTHSIDTVISTYNLIDSISLINDNVTTENNGLIEIHYL